MVEICQGVLDGFGMPAEFVQRMVVPIFMGKGNIRNCSCFVTIKLVEHGMKVMDRVFDKGFVELCLLMKCNLALCLKEEQLMLCLSCLKKKVVYVILWT